MSARQDALRATLGRVGVWSFSLQNHPAAAAGPILAAWRAAGLRAVWYPESLGSKEAFAHSAILLAQDPGIVAATGIASIYARDAMAMANGARTLQDAYPGRFVLGIGVSHQPSVEARGAAYGPPVETMRAYLDAMDAVAWAGPAGVERPPVVLAALGPRMLALAAERADGAHPYFVPVEHTAFARERLGAEPVLAVEVTAVLDADRARARETARAFSARYLALRNYARNLERLGVPPAEIADGGSDRLIDSVVAQGDAAAIVARVRAHLDAGADHVCLQLRAGDPTDPCTAGYAEVAAGLAELL